MQVETFHYDRESRAWSAKTFPALDSERTLVLAFGAPEMRDEGAPFAALRKAYPKGVVVGCSSAGEIVGTSVRDGTLSVAVARFDRTPLLSATVEVKSAAASFEAGRDLARKLARPDLRGVLVLSEGLGVNGSQLVAGINAVLPDSVVVTGGLSGDGTAFKRTWVAVGDQVKSGLVVAVGFYGDSVKIGHGSKGGWDKFGPERVVTKSEGNVLHTLDGKPALALYKEYLGEKAKDLPASGLLFPLAMRATARDDKFLVRTLLAVDHDKQTMTFAGDIPKGHLVQLMKANFDRLIDGASLAAVDAGKGAPDATLAVAVSCVGRRIVLGDRTEEEVEAALEALPKGAKITGFYSYGEISPYAAGHCDLHNQTMTLTTFSEVEPATAKRPAPAAAKKPGTAFGRALAPRLPSATAEIEDGDSAEPTTARPRPGLTPAGGIRVETFFYDLDKRSWSVSPLPALDSERTLVVCFGAPGLADDPAPFAQLKRTYPRAAIVGCSSAGEIVGTTVRDRSLSVAVVRFARTPLSTAVVEVKSAAGSFEAGRDLARKLARPDLRGVLVLSEGLGVNGSQLVAGINAVLPDSVVVTGGLSGDGTAFKRTWVAVGDQVKSGVVVAVGFHGDHVTIGHGSKGGWDKFGPERVVTRSEGNVLHTLDGKPALALYKEYLGEKAKDLPASGLLFPLAMRAGAKDDKFLVRTLLAVDHEAQTMTFAGDVPKGHLVQLMKANFDRLIDGASLAAQGAKEIAPRTTSATLAIAVSCVGRRIVLGDRTEEEVEAALEALPEGAKITGFYSYGEISPYATGHCDLHNQTMTLTLFGESETPVARRAPAPAPAPKAVEAEDPIDSIETQAGPSTESGGAMRVETFAYDLATRRWSAPLPALDSEQTLVVCFGAPEIIDDAAPVRELKRTYPKARVVGCSSAGEIVGATVRDRTLSVAVTRFAKTTLSHAVVEVKSAADSFEAGRTLAKRLDRSDLRGVLVLSEGLGVNGSQLVAGINAVLPDSVVVTGGLSGDGTAFKRTWVAVGDQVKSGVVVAVGFYGDHIAIGHGSKGGWDKFGPERVITKSEGNVLHTLDGKPALALYKEYLGEKAKDLPASGLLFPLAMRATAKDDKFLVRTLLAVDHEAQTMTFAGDVPKGHLVQLMKANFDRLIDGASLAAQGAKEIAPRTTSATLAIAVSCVGRRIVLGDRTEEEVEAALEALPEGAKITGFYSYGEISPYATGHCDLHNQTMTLTTFSETEMPLPKRASGPARAAAITPAAEEEPRPAPKRAARVEATPDSGDTPAPAAKTSPSITPERQLAARSGEVRKAAPPGAGGATATYDVRRLGSLLAVRIAGRLTEAWKGAAVAKKLEGDVLFDLGAVERITSFGVREWLQMVKEAEPRVKSLYFARCAEPVVNQMTMIKAFTGGAQIVSFWAPYRCDGCGASFERLCDCETDAGAITEGRAPEARCPQCNAAGSFDDDPQTYFGFAAPHAGREVPREVREALEELGQLGEPVGGEAVEKTVDGRLTRVKVNVKIDAALRWNRILDGLEGQVVIDLGAAPAITPEGAAAFASAALRLAGDVDAIRIEGCPRALGERFAQGTPPKLTVASVVVDGRCAPCNATRSALIPLADHAAALRDGKDPVIACRRCGAPLSFDAVRPLLAKLAGDTAAVSAAEPAGSKPPPASESAPRPAEDQRRAQPDRGMSRATVGVIAALGAAVVILGVNALRGEAPKAPPPIATAAPATTAATTATAAARGWGQGADLPPPWVERPFAVDGETVYVVGHGGPAPSEEAALAQARPDALERLVSGMIGELAGSPVQEFVQARAIAPERRRESVDAIARRFLKQLGATAAPERADVVTRRRDGGVEAFARYKLSKQAFTAAADVYKQTASFQGLTVARFFPTLEGSIRTDGEIIVIAAQSSWQADLKTVRPGDIILDVAGHPVTTVDAFSRAAADEWARTPPGATVTLQIESLGARRPVRVLKAPAGNP